MKPPYSWEIRDCSFDWERCRAVKGLGQPEFYLLKDFESDKRKDLFWAEQYKTLIKLSVKHLPCPPAICKNWGKPYDPEEWKNTANHCLLFSWREAETAPHSVVTHRTCGFESHFMFDRAANGKRGKERGGGKGAGSTSEKKRPESVRECWWKTCLGKNRQSKRSSIISSLILLHQVNAVSSREKMINK